MMFRHYCTTGKRRKQGENSKEKTKAALPLVLQLSFFHGGGECAKNKPGTILYLI